MKYLYPLLLALFTLPTSAQSQHGIGLTWTPSTSTGVTSQLVCRSTAAGGENCAAPLATISNNTTTSYLDTTGTGGTQYFYVLEACINAICSVPSTEAHAVFPTVPAPPTGLVASPQ